MFYQIDDDDEDDEKDNLALNRAHLCHYCGKSFTRLGFLTKHQNNYCYWNPKSKDFGIQRPFICPICGASYSKQKILNSHLRFDCGRTHVCPDCNKTFLHSSSLRKHRTRACVAKPLTI